MIRDAWVWEGGYVICYVMDAKAGDSKKEDEGTTEQEGSITREQGNATTASDVGVQDCHVKLS